MKIVNLKIIIRAFILISALSLGACSHEEEVRSPADILGVWSPGENTYLEFLDNYEIQNLKVEYQDGLSIGRWTTEVYYYEPGYNLVVYVADNKANVYQVVSMNSRKLTWCKVDEITTNDVDGAESLGHIIGDIIKKAQEGYHLNPELYQTLIKIPEEEFLDIIDNLDINI
ncbi:MAG: hypothetical protein J1F12_06600 [Muribaculaceae bacterium]|nr:hypothetical protein [Muribaculaceae bacterium]